MTSEPRYEWITDPVTGRKKYRKVREAAPRGVGPAFIRDDCDVVSMVDGQRYTSKAALRASYRRNGYIEAGGEDIAKFYPPPREPEGVRRTIKRALERAGIN